MLFETKFEKNNYKVESIYIILGRKIQSSEERIKKR